MARSFEPTFSTVRVTPAHPPTAGAVKDTQPFIQPAKPDTVTDRASIYCYIFTVSWTDFSAVKHQLTSKTQPDRSGSNSSERTGKDFSAANHQSTSQLKTNPD